MPADSVDREADREADEGALFVPASPEPVAGSVARATEAGRAADMVRAAVAAAKGGADARRRIGGPSARPSGLRRWSTSSRTSTRRSARPSSTAAGRC